MPRQKVPLDPEAFDRVIEAMKAGATLRQACAKPGAPSWHLVNAWRREHPGVDWYVRVLAHRSPPGASAALAKLVAEAREEWKLGRWAGRDVPQWSDYAPRLRRMEEGVAVRQDDLGPVRPVDPADPETCF